MVLRDGVKFSYSNKNLSYPKPSRYSHQRWKLTPTRRSRFYAQMVEGSTAVKTQLESARSQMYGKKVPLELWGLAVQCAVYVQNRTTSCTNSKTPFEYWYQKKPDIFHLKVFGCRVFVHVPDEKRRKLDPKATEGMMMGYLDESKSCYMVGPFNS